jgi:hypothetical protein
MGYIRHQGIIITGSDASDIGGKHDTALAREKALALGLPCSDIVRGTTNGYTSFLIAPDGSKEGWQTSNEQEAKRKEWIAWARSCGLFFDWVCVNFGGDDYDHAFLDDHNGKSQQSA